MLSGVRSCIGSSDEGFVSGVCSAGLFRGLRFRLSCLILLHLVFPFSMLSPS